MLIFQAIVENRNLIAGAIKRTIKGISQHDHEDLCSDVALALVSRLEGFDPARGHLKGFIGHVAHNMAIDWARRAKVRTVDPLEGDDGTIQVADHSSGTPEAALIAAQERATLALAVKRLPQAWQEFATAMLSDDFSVESYAAKHGIKEGTVYTRSLKLKEKLAKMVR